MSGEPIEFEHAWRHFQLHAAQRVSVFNFFVASAGLLLSGLAYVLQSSSAPWTLGVLAGLSLTALSFLFWKLDQRAGDLVKRAEDSLIEFEKDRLSEGHRLFGDDAGLSDSRKKWNVRGVWTYGRSFRILFWALGLLGLTGSGVVLWRHLSSSPTVTVQQLEHHAASLASASPSLPAPAVSAGPRLPAPAMSATGHPASGHPVGAAAAKADPSSP